MFLLAGKTPTHKRSVTCFHSKRTSHLKGLCERSSPTLPHTSGWFVPAATPCSKEDKNLPSSTCMKRPSPAISPRPGGAHALLPYHLQEQGDGGWDGGRWEHSPTGAAQVCPWRGARGTGMPCSGPVHGVSLGSLSSPEPSQSTWRSKQHHQTWVRCAETWAQAPGRVGASWHRVRTFWKGFRDHRRDCTSS